MASIKKNENKKGISYKIIVSNGYDNNGKKIVQTTTFVPDAVLTQRQQEKELERFVYEFEDKVKRGYSFDGEKMSFDEFAKKWLKSIEPTLAYGTYRSYKIILDNKILPFFGHYKVTKINLLMVEDFYNLQVDKVKSSTAKKYSTVLNLMFKTAMRWNIIEVNPCTNAVMPKRNKKATEIKYFTPTQSLAFLASLNEVYEDEYKAHDRIRHTGKTCYVKGFVRIQTMSTQHKVFFNIALLCGMRKGEILALHWEDIDFKNNMISITKSASKTADGIVLKEPKTKTSIRNVSVPEKLIPLLQQYKKEYNINKLQLGDYWKGTGNLFIQDDGKLMGYDTPYNHFKKHIQRYNNKVDSIPGLSQKQKVEKMLPIIPLHGLRHSCATLLNFLDVNIVDISKVLGHAQTSTTMNIYAHSFEGQNRVASDKIDAFLKVNA